MKSNRFWIETVMIGTAMACALALLIATLATATDAITEPNPGQAGQTVNASVNPTQAQSGLPLETYEGMVTCTRCGAKHSAKLGKTATDCTLVCVHGGSKFALIDGDKAYQLEGDVAALKRLAGQRAHISGVIRGDTITVSAASAS